jgi:prolyl oligopeptidase
MRHSAALFLTALSLAAADGPPVAKTIPVTETLHGVAITDPYRWLEDQNSPETRSWLEAENAYTRAYLDKIPGREKLKQRLTALGRVDAVGLPTLRNGRYFFTRRFANENRSSICMRVGFEGKDEVLVDPATVGDESWSINLMGVSDDGKLMAYAARRGGEDEVEVRLLDVDKRELLPFRLPRARYAGISIKPDRTGIFYSRYTTGQGGRVYYHAMAGAAGSDPEIFGGQYGPEALISARLTEDGKYLVLVVAFGVPPRKTEIYVQNVAAGGPIQKVLAEDGESRPFLEADDRLFISTNWKAPNQRILVMNLSRRTPGQWTEVVPESEWPIEAVSAAGGRIFVHYLENVKTRIKQYTAAGKYLGDLKLPGIGSVSGLAGRWREDEAFFTYASFAEPGTDYRYRVSSSRQDIWFRPSVPVVADNFEVKQVWYESRDKTRVPMFLVHKKGLTPDGDRPVYLTAYGGFNLSETPAFSRAAVIWAEMGGVFALPNLRGGGEFGEKWHHGGMFENKQNVFDDFIAAAEWLVANHYTKPARISIQGGSNGGLLVGAAFTQRPDLFGAVVCAVPLLDMLRYQKFKVGSYWVTEYGSADDPKQFPYLLKYSPYQNVKKGAQYPAIMFVSGDSDTRVDPLHARKMAALVQASTGSGRPVYLDYDTKSGHSGGKPLSAQIEEWTDWMSFLLDQTGVRMN